MMMKSLPTASRVRAHDLQRQAHAVRIVAAPFVVALVGGQAHELVDEVALGAHDLHAVVARFARQGGAAHEGADLPLDAARGKRNGVNGEMGDLSRDGATASGW